MHITNVERLFENEELQEKMMNLEKRRQLLEDLEIIEDAISTRFRRNPKLYYDNVIKETLIDGNIQPHLATAVANNRIYKTKKIGRSRKQLVTQQHEINRFLLQALSKLEQLNGEDELVALSDNDYNFNTFQQEIDRINKEHASQGWLTLQVNEKIAKYEMFSASSSSKLTILSENARELDVNQIFTRREQYGEQLDLKKFYNQWLNVIKRADCSYLQFFDILQKFLDHSAYLLSPPMDRKNERYGLFLIELSHYLEEYFTKVYILVDATVFSRKIESDFEQYLKMTLSRSNQGLYCIACGKWFKGSTVFQSHLTGKHHNKNRDKRCARLLAEYKVHRYLRILQKQFDCTRDFLERKLAFTTEERIKEMSELVRTYEGADCIADEEKEIEGNEARDTNILTSKKENGSNRVDLPLGLDGLPIPLWLYKLQGLDVIYSCEICGNQTYRGRRMFERHFTDSKHLFHLKCLGIEASESFKSITSIKEAQNLWKRISAANNKSSRDIEVEDEYGNVMTQQVYEELKKQGLV